ncbi:SLC13 family permease [Maribacter litopenaei]|uniref:SLC13 family permease n=1 Tax=Maribacter litopenaei TaxID=2976127 RepID=A0ABY5YBY5_9FLAO|nr:SLC13 family permease [Maribacter litopenaei]UWX56229.1 SLC13 family permease [Maribacter litopenaei]
MLYLIGLLVALVFLIVSIVKIKVHPFFSLLLTSIVYALITGMEPDLIVDSINSGFGDILGKIGLIILFGVTIGTILEKSGGAFVIASKILNLIGEKSIHLAMMLTGYFLSIPIFADSALLMMNPLNKVLSKKTGMSYAGTTAALAMGLTASHVMVPPTPGPIAAAGILGANLGDVILWGLIISFISLIPCYFYAKNIASGISIPILLEPITDPEKKPALWKSLLAILIPLILILAKSVIEYPGITGQDTFFKRIISLLGTPVIALLIGVLLSLLIPRKLDERIFSSTGWIGESLKIAAPIILITGAGGIFGKTLQNSGIAEVITTSFSRFATWFVLPLFVSGLFKDNTRFINGGFSNNGFYSSALNWNIGAK